MTDSSRRIGAKAKANASGGGLSGAQGGIGSAVRRSLEACGTCVIGIDLAAAEVVADLETADGRMHAAAEVLRLCGGRLDGLVCAAGLGGTTLPAADWLLITGEFAEKKKIFHR